MAVDRKLTKIVFTAIVFFVLIPGLAAFTLTKRDTDRLNVFMLNKARKILRGKACKKEILFDGSMKYQQVPNAEVH